MGLTPVQFLESFVEGNTWDYKENPGCIRRAFNASVTASHLADHYHAFYSRHDPDLVASYPSLAQFIKHLNIETEGAFRDIRSLANVYKHLYTDNDQRKAAQSTVDSCGSIISLALEASAEVIQVEQKYRETDSVVVFRRKDGTSAEFLPVLEKVIAYWNNFL